MPEDVALRTWKHYEARACKGWVMLPKLNRIRLPMTHQQLLDNIQRNDGTSLQDAQSQVASFEKSFRDE